VKGADVEVAGFVVAQYVLHPLFHFFGGLVGKGEGQYVKRVHPLCHQVGNAGGKHFGFSGAGSGHNHERAIHMQHGFPLPLIQTL